MTVKEMASLGGKARAAKRTPEERREEMKRIASRPRPGRKKATDPEREQLEETAAGRPHGFSAAVLAVIDDDRIGLPGYYPGIGFE